MEKHLIRDEKSPEGYESPPCLAHEIDPIYSDPLAVDATWAYECGRLAQGRAHAVAVRADPANALADLVRV